MTPFRRLSLATFLLGLVIAVPQGAPADGLLRNARMPLLPVRSAVDGGPARDPLITRMPDLTRIAADAVVSSDDAVATVSTASLFAGTRGRSFFAPLPPRDRSGSDRGARDRQSGQGDVADTGWSPDRSGGAADRVRHLIAAAEAGAAGYDAVQHGARIRPHDVPTSLTIAQIYDWIDATPGQPHAIGRYQFIPATLRRLVEITGIDPQATFSPAVQDALADVLLAEAGFSDLAAGRIDRVAFMNNLAKIWAGLPTSNGRSHYDGYAGNKATMTWARYDAEMRTIFPG